MGIRWRYRIFEPSIPEPASPRVDCLYASEISPCRVCPLIFFRSHRAGMIGAERRRNANGSSIAAKRTAGSGVPNPGNYSRVAAIFRDVISERSCIFSPGRSGMTVTTSVYSPSRFGSAAGNWAPNGSESQARWAVSQHDLTKPTQR